MVYGHGVEGITPRRKLKIMKIKVAAINSIGIRNGFKNESEVEVEIVGSVGDGDQKMTLYRSANGAEVIGTNGDPCWEGQPGFAEAREMIAG